MVGPIDPICIFYIKFSCVVVQATRSALKLLLPPPPALGYQTSETYYINNWCTILYFGRRPFTFAGSSRGPVMAEYSIIIYCTIWVWKVSHKKLLLILFDFAYLTWTYAIYTFALVVCWWPKHGTAAVLHTGRYTYTILYCDLIAKYYTPQLLYA